MDANTNRAREGARVEEDIARFVIDDKALSAGWKAVRHRISEISLELGKGLETRDAENDPGKFIEAQEEDERKDLIAVASANAKRCEEALRALEEYSKLLSVKASRKFKELRFDVYTLEKETVSKIINLNREQKR
jgi:thiamine-phosphate pyrophosphorylase